MSAGEPPHDFDSIGFAAIGSGAPAALASLSFATDHYGFGRYSDMRESAYHLLAAKFMSESATDVGQNTFFLSVGKNGNFFLHSLGMEAVRKSWMKHGAPKTFPTNYQDTKKMCSIKLINILKRMCWKDASNMETGSKRTSIGLFWMPRKERLYRQIAKYLRC